jgi:chitinase
MLIMKLRRTVLALAFLAVSVPCALRAQTSPVVCGYYPEWNRALLPAASVDTSILTHVAHAFAWPTADGYIQGSTHVPDAALIDAVHAGGRKVLLALGGYDHSTHFTTVTLSPALRSTFAENLAAYVAGNGYDGVDLDWEFPSTAAERDSMVSLVREIRQAFTMLDSTLLITMAIPATDWNGRWFPLTALVPWVDWFNAMTYDYHGSWTAHAGHNAPLAAPGSDPDGSVSQSIQYLLTTRGLPASKVTLGIPFYGRAFSAAALYGPSTGVQDLSYHDVALLPAAEWTRTWDALAQVPYLTNAAHTTVVTFDDSASVAAKCAYARSRSLRGVMVWALGQDVTPAGQALLRSIGQAMGSPTAVDRDAPPPVPERSTLLPCWPNPWNPSTNVRFALATEGHVMLTVHDLLGRTVATLVNERRAAGNWDVRLDAGREWSSGLYLIRLQTGGQAHTTKALLLR